MSPSKCARCDKTVYPVEELRCLDKLWHKGCFKCEECNMTLSMKNYKGFEKRPYCNAHCPQAKATTVADTPEIRRLAENTRIQSQAKYHEDFEKSKGKGFTTVLDDPEMRRIKESSKLISNVAYHGELERKKQMEERRTSGGPEETFNNNGNNNNNNNAKHQNKMQSISKAPQASLEHTTPNHQAQQHQQQQQRLLQHQQQQQQKQNQQAQQQQQQQQQLQNQHYMQKQQMLLKQQQQYNAQNRQSALVEGIRQQQQHHHHTTATNANPRDVQSQHLSYQNNNHAQQQHMMMMRQQQQQQIAMHQQQQRQSMDLSIPMSRQTSKQTIIANNGHSLMKHPQMVPGQNQAPIKYAPMTDPVTGLPIAPNLLGGPAPPHMMNHPAQLAAMQQQRRLATGANPHQQQMAMNHHQQQHNIHHMMPNHVVGSMNGAMPKHSSASSMGNMQQLPSHMAAAHHDQTVHQLQMRPASFAGQPVYQPMPNQVPRRVFRAMYDYVANDVDEVSFFENDILIDCVNVDRNWLIGKVARSGQTGMLPANYVAELPSK